MVQQLSTNTFGTAKWIVSPTASDGTHTTIASALTSASSGDTIFIRPGTYTENLTLKAGVNLASYNCDAQTPNVTIVGKCTFTAAGTVTISGIRLQTNSDNFLAVTGSAASVVYLNNCYLNCTNATGITFSSSSSSAAIYLNNCYGDLGTTGVALYAHTSSGNLWLYYCVITNSGGSTTANNNSAGSVFFLYCNVSLPLTTSSTGSVTLSYSIVTGGSATSALVTAGTGTSAIEASRLESGTASAISIGTGTTVEVKGVVNASSSNANAITGAGQIKFNKIYYYSSSGNNVTTKSSNFISEYSIQKSSLQPAFLAVLASTLSNVTGDGTTYTVVFDTTVTNQSSSWNGSTTFTAPVTGLYFLTAQLLVGSLTASFTGMYIAITTTARNYLGAQCNPGVQRDGVSNQMTATLTCLANMTAGDTAILKISVSGSTKTISLPTGGATDPRNYFAGYLVA
jgi:hypothetical protein